MVTIDWCRNLGEILATIVNCWILLIIVVKSSGLKIDSTFESVPDRRLNIALDLQPAKVYYLCRNLIEGGGTEKIPSSPNLPRSSCRSGSRQMAVCITCFLQETKSCATLKCMHLIKELNARNLILQTPVMLSDDYMWSKNVWIYQIQSTPTLILMNSSPENY